MSGKRDEAIFPPGKNVGISFVIITLYKLILIILHIMKKFIITSILVALFAAGTSIIAQDRQEEYLGLPGDNLNLYAVMKLFQESKTLEEFERNLNDEKSNINNLDLNGDGLIDYIRVFDNIDGDVHNIVLQVAVSPKENQDLAVFTVQRFNNGQVQIQLTGDEELYGKNYIIEPIFDDANAAQTLNPGYTGNVTVQNITYVRTTPFEIAGWPLVRFIYLPSYTAWRSSWYWGYYPNYWNPWRPFYWHYYYGYHNNWNNDYYGHYRRWDSHRYSRWNDFYYTGRRSYSPDVYHRIEVGTYKTTYSHPDQRKDGEAKFAKMHPDQYRRSTDNSSGNNSFRRSGSQSTNKAQSTGNRTNTSRRSNTTVTNKSVTNPPSGQNTGTTRRSNTTVTKKSITNPSSVQNTGTTRRSTTTVTNKSVSNPGQNAATNRSVRQSKSTGVKSSKSTKRIKTEAKTKQGEKTKDSDNRETNRRK
jgi:hypothetical protein